MLQNVAQEEAAAQSFYQTYFCDILQHIFSVVTDTSHTAGELTHSSKLQYHPETVKLEQQTREVDNQRKFCLFCRQTCLTVATIVLFVQRSRTH